MGSRKGKVLRVKLCGGMAMSSYKDYKKKALQNSEIKVEYDILQSEYDIIQTMINARVGQNTESIFLVRNCQKQGKGNRWNND